MNDAERKDLLDRLWTAERVSREAVAKNAKLQRHLGRLETALEMVIRQRENGVGIQNRQVAVIEDILDEAAKACGAG